MKIKTNPSAYFFSESIFMNPNTTLEVSLSELSDVQVQDIYEGTVTGRLESDSKDQLFDEFKKRLAKTGKIAPDVTSNIDAKIKALEEKLKTAAQNIPSTDELEKLLKTLKEAKKELDTLNGEVTVPSFVSKFRAQL